MPPPTTPKPEFNPYGRYAIDVRTRTEPGDTLFHDSENYTANCGMDGVPTESISRFNNRDWAISRGYVECGHCKV